MWIDFETCKHFKSLKKFENIRLIVYYGKKIILIYRLIDLWHRAMMNCFVHSLCT